MRLVNATSLFSEDALAALAVELRDSVLLDLFLARDAEFFLDFDLDRESVRVPARFAHHAMSTHGLVAAHEVLAQARDDMMDAGLAVGGGRSFVEHEGAIRRPALDAAREDALALPELRDGFFGQRHVLARCEFGKGRRFHG